MLDDLVFRKGTWYPSPSDEYYDNIRQKRATNCRYWNRGRRHIFIDPSNNYVMLFESFDDGECYDDGFERFETRECVLAIPIEKFEQLLPLLGFEFNGEQLSLFERKVIK